MYTCEFPYGKMYQFHTTSDLIYIQLRTPHLKKDMGVIFDECLTFEQHLNEEINSLVGIIRRTFEYLDINNFMQLRPQIEYANQIWTPYMQNTSLHWKMFKDAQQSLFHP